MYAFYKALNDELKVDYLMFIEIGGKANLSNKWLMKLVSEAVGIPPVTSGQNMSQIRKNTA